ncbi:MAG: hypothetical protein KFF50_12250, partial [Desulfatitalea sp.]|nr:hypothetical protein [Desulfatitalea sp.]
ALQRWPEWVSDHRFEMQPGQTHEWQYRGQVIPANQKVTVDAIITHITDGPEPVITADGWLHVDGLCIYKMVGFGVRLVGRGGDQPINRTTD